MSVWSTLWEAGSRAICIKARASVKCKAGRQMCMMEEGVAEVWRESI